MMGDIDLRDDGSYTEMYRVISDDLIEAIEDQPRLCLICGRWGFDPCVHVVAGGGSNYGLFQG